MKICEILDGYKGKFCRRDISNLAFRLDEIRENTLYFNLKNDISGEAATQLGAIVVEEKRCITYPSIRVENARKAFSLSCKRFYHNAVDSLKVFAVTGTNGKTTTVSILKDIFEFCGFSVALIGTNGVKINDRYYPPTLTTPDPDKLHAIFYECEKSGVSHVVMEASAHALELYKLEGINFVVSGFTNFTQDHLDFFKDMERYANAKKRLFEMSKSSVINLDDRFGQELVSAYNSLTYGILGGKLTACDIILKASGSEFTVKYKGEQKRVRLPLAGEYSVMNALCALGMAIKGGVKFLTAVSALEAVLPVDGRMNIIESEKGTIVIDFAHTEDGLKKLLKAVRGFTKGKVIVVFGCGGNRDKDKRAKMGKVASENADIVVITSDNPRYEEPMNIIRMIEKGIKSKKGVDYFIEPLREKAIEFALKMMKKDDCIVVAGKGAENYIDEKGIKRPYSDTLTVNRLLKEINNA
jgi:UDP-N-acetylmuramoyl-L-alanyl-D-glutamate--2,6-diaminopimelate ligase